MADRMEPVAQVRGLLPGGDGLTRWATPVPGAPTLPEGTDLFTAAQLAAAVEAERERWEDAIRQAWKMVDPLCPAGSPGSYSRGVDNGIVSALKQVRANITQQKAAAIRSHQPAAPAKGE